MPVVRSLSLDALCWLLIGSLVLCSSPTAWSQEAGVGKPLPKASARPSKSQNGALAQGADAKEAAETKIPPAKPKYLGRRIAQTMSFHGANWLIRGEREQEERPSQVLPQLGLKPGMTVCDLGCGNGFYSIAMAKIIAPGNVLAVDIQPEMLHLLKLRATEAGVENIKPLQGTVVDPQLSPSSVDLVLMVDVYHEFSHPEQMLAAIRKSLKPGGLIALLEYREEDPHVPIKPEHKMSKQQILKEYRANGLKLAKQYDELPWQHLMFFEADPSFKE
ncbi:MAG: class I SAM-dependent methyltransferase [Pirellulaceae bacterium]|nr:class I SAM-dependent methyltransferase [Pirellulaceae bacterium]